MSKFNDIYTKRIISNTNENISILASGSGEILVNTQPVSALGIATKTYVDTVASLPVVSVSAATTSSYNVPTNGTLISCRYSTIGPQTIILPLISSVVIGKIYHIVDTFGNAQVYNITITTSGSDTINNAASVLLNGNYQSFSIYADSVNKWFIF